jgi:hypothetical protein
MWARLRRKIVLMRSGSGKQSERKSFASIEGVILFLKSIEEESLGTGKWAGVGGKRRGKEKVEGGWIDTISIQCMHV